MEKLSSQKEVVPVVKGVILHKGKVLLIKRANHVHFGGGTWEFVGGKLEFGEDLEDGLVREIKEETGLDVNVEKILYAKSIQEPARQLVVLTYLCKCNGNNVILSKEHVEYMWAAKNELLNCLSPVILLDLKKNNVFAFIK